ncbi:hypothetical protein [Wansuia hejianensis]|uniref:Uncharacterized protein n=1 Tax=Wansuia hejianensis TaxID=2763667 RepID=A0A926EXB8_9FIRM|nr:hypothetical protein [Wansuia hejianensis]MBC8590048.1 hypothetical protein [Wansuia hejianensis]
MKTTFKYIGVAMIVIFVVVCILYLNNDIGTSKSNIEKDARMAHKIDDSWQVSKSTTDNMSAMLFYDKNLDNHTFSIYVNRSGLSFGYFFRGGGSITVEDKDIVQYQIQGYQEKAYLSMNKQHIIKIEVDRGDTIEVINIDSTKPFALVLPSGMGIVKFYDVNGEVVEPIFQSL